MQVDCYLLTAKENLMPCTLDGFDSDGLARVVSPNGTEYTANPGNLVTVEDAADMFRDKRADRMIHQGYVCMKLQGHRWRVWHPGKHGVYGGYVVTDGETPSCTCADFERRQKPCKHMKALPDLQRFAQVEKPTIRVTSA